MALKEKIIKCFQSKAYSYQNAADVQPEIAERLAKRLKPIRAQRILEIGCGTGFLSQYLVKQFPEAHILLTDVAPAMVAITAERFQHCPNVQVKQMDGEALPTEMQFDLIVSSMTLHWFSDLSASLQQIIRLLAPQGEFLFAMLGKNSISEWRSVFQEQQLLAPTPRFPDHEHLQQTMPQLKTEVELTKQRYENTHSFLKTLKAIGAHAPHANHVALTAAKLRKLMRRFDAISFDGVRISYEVVYGSYVKS